MDTIVTARIPVEIKAQAAEILRQIDANPTQLINAAYEYVLSTGTLPCAPQIGDKKKRSLSAVEKKELLASIERTSFDVPAVFWEEGSYKEVIAGGRRANYEALA